MALNKKTCSSATDGRASRAERIIIYRHHSRPNAAGAPCIHWVIHVTRKYIYHAKSQPGIAMDAGMDNHEWRMAMFQLYSRAFSAYAVTLIA